MTTAVLSPSRDLPASAIALLVVLMASWGFQLVTVKLALPDLSPVLQSLVRAVISTAALTLFMAARGERPVARDDTLVPGIVVGVVFAVEFLLIFGGLARTTASRGVVFLYTMPFFMTGLSAIFLPGEKLERGRLLGLGAAFAGLVVAFADGLVGTAAGATLVGDLMMVAAAFTWAATTIYIKRSPLVRASASRVLWFQLALSIPVSALAALAGGATWPTSVSAVTVAAILYQSLWVAFLTYVVWFWLVARYSPPLLSSFSFLAPLFGVLFGHLVLDEAVGWSLVLALALVIGGIVLVNRTKPAR